MSLERPASALPGVRYGAVARMTDSRGAFRELWRADAFGIEPGDAGADPTTAPTFVQANLSTSAPGVLRGLHYHQRQLDYWVVASGRAFVALVDLRPVLDGSGGRPVVETRELGEDGWVVIPAGVAHGFLALEDATLVLYKCTEIHTPEAERAVHYADAKIGIDWPLTPTLVAPKDAAAPPLEAAEFNFEYRPR